MQQPRRPLVRRLMVGGAATLLVTATAVATVQTVRLEGAQVQLATETRAAQRQLADAATDLDRVRRVARDADAAAAKRDRRRVEVELLATGRAESLDACRGAVTAAAEALTAMDDGAAALDADDDEALAAAEAVLPGAMDELRATGATCVGDDAFAVPALTVPEPVVVTVREEPEPEPQPEPASEPVDPCEEYPVGEECAAYVAVQEGLTETCPGTDAHVADLSECTPEFLGTPDETDLCEVDPLYCEGYADEVYDEEAAQAVIDAEAAAVAEADAMYCAEHPDDCDG